MQTKESLMDLIGRTDDHQVKIPKDIESPEDFVAWCRNIDRYSFDEEGIRAALYDIGEDGEGCIKDDLKTASRTFFKGHKREEVINWINEAFSEENA